MITVEEEYGEYVAELRERVCGRCIVRRPGTPPWRRSELLAASNSMCRSW